MDFGKGDRDGSAPSGAGQAANPANKSVERPNPLAICQRSATQPGGSAI